MKENTRTEAPTRATIASILKEIGLLLELQGSEPFRAAAYARAARAVAVISEDLATLVEQHRLTEINGVGRGLAAQIQEAQAAGDPDLGDTYYLHWLAAFEHLVAARGLVSAEELARRKGEWAEAARTTPHGKPIELVRTGDH
jgi:DNA polymerase/3'-5' exonuclease PolX